MWYSFYEGEFRKIAEKRNIPNTVIDNCLTYAKPLVEQGVPVIYNTTHLSKLVGYTRSYIKRATHHTSYFYRTYAIPKKNGSNRYISEPLPSLKEIQLVILNEILGKIKVSRYAKAYVSGRSILDHLKFHKGEKAVLTLDIKDYFSSINLASVEQIFKKIGYIDIVSNLLARLCTKDDVLPQGAPTSPYLSNLYLKDFDEEIASIVRPLNINYTRYADDMAFSGASIDEKLIIDTVGEKLANLSLEINSSKTLSMVAPKRQIISGVVVNEKLQVPRNIRRNIRQAVYYIEKYGLTNHMTNQDINKRNYDKHLLGVVNYVLFINPGDQEFRRYREVLQGIVNTADNNA